MYKQTNTGSLKLDKNMLKLLESALILGFTFPVKTTVSLLADSPETINYIFYILRSILMGDIFLEALKLSKAIIINNQIKINTTQELENVHDEKYDYNFEYQPVLSETLTEQQLQEIPEINTSSHYKARRMARNVEQNIQDEPKVHKIVPIPTIGSEL